MTDVQKIKLQRWWMEQLREITRKVMREEEKRKEKATKKTAAALAEYSSRESILDSYGYGIITERVKDKLLDMWDEREINTDEMYQAKIDLLQDVYTEAQITMRDLGQEV